jgi:hypothetical protein
LFEEEGEVVANLDPRARQQDAAEREVPKVLL